ncbi:MAG: twin-arginine translocation signal domain-containing protein, partial [Gemmatimonadales bacterium]
MTDHPEPLLSSEWSRRDFVKLLGASMALAGLSGCVRAPADEILPYVGTPPDAPPGSARHFATAMTLDGYATGLLVESRDGRPVKIEGNPDHPASRGAAGIFEQASLLSLYDPDRARQVRHGGRGSTWDALREAFSPAALHRRAGARGAGLRLLLEPTSSPMLAALLDRFRTEYPEARVYFHASLASNDELAAARASFGRPLLPQLDLRQAEVIVSLGADLLASGPFHLRYSRDYADRRRSGEQTSWYVAETAPSPTGTLARQRIAASPLKMPAIAAAILRAIAPASTPPAAAGAPPISPVLDSWIAATALDLGAHRGRSLVVAD